MENVFDGGTKTPSLSWKDCPIGTVFEVEILDTPKLLHSRDFDTGEPAFWDDAKTQAKMSAVLNVRVLSGPHSVGEERSIWAQKPSSLFQAIAAAQAQAGELITKGGKLGVRFHSEKPHENKRFNAIKIYEARYTPPAAPPAFSSTPQQQGPPVTAPANPGMVGWSNPAGTVKPPPAKPTW